MEMVRKENSTLKERLEHMEYEYRIREESVIREHNAAAKLSVRQALMSVEQEMSVLKKEHDDYVLLQQKYKDLGRISFHEGAVLLLFIVCVFLWFLRDPHFITGWAQLLPDV